ncbi:hypothetical protein A2326_03980 [candidate division WWE3 bacterium RIFOXYB2_FULL_41_6]|nr:MAG: hypothetical protein A2326_03980 [candidate division WWE3 bacterium RIFOXYB2_FULL_41_6]
MKVLVTGAAGFIGSYISRALINRGDDVIGIDNFDDYYPRKSKEFNLDLVYLIAEGSVKYLPENETMPVFEKINSFLQADTRLRSRDIKGKFVFEEGNMIDEGFVRKSFEKNKPDAVIHLAAKAGVPSSLRDPTGYVKTNMVGTANIIEACRDLGIKKFVFGSSSTVYGNREDRKIHEDDDILHPESPYGATKVGGEIFCYTASKVYGIKTTVCRIIGPIYGPLQRQYGMFMQRAINFTFNDREISIYGKKGLETSKNSTYIDDLVYGLLLCLDYDKNFDVFNIGSGEAQKISDWIGEIEKAMGKKVKYTVVEADKGDVGSSVDIAKAQKILGYNPAMQLSQGVKRQVETFLLMPDWYKNQKTV